MGKRNWFRDAWLVLLALGVCLIVVGIGLEASLRWPLVTIVGVLVVLSGGLVYLAGPRTLRRGVTVFVVGFGGTLLLHSYIVELILARVSVFYVLPYVFPLWIFPDLSYLLLAVDAYFQSIAIVGVCIIACAIGWVRIRQSALRPKILAAGIALAFVAWVMVWVLDSYLVTIHLWQTFDLAYRLGFRQFEVTSFVLLMHHLPTELAHLVAAVFGVGASALVLVSLNWGAVQRLLALE